MRFRAVLFDLGQTILDYGPHGRWAEFRVRRMEELYPLAREMWGEIEISPAGFGKAIGEGIQTERIRALEHSGLSLRFSERLREALAGVGITADEATRLRLLEVFSEPIREWPKPYPETEAVLNRLRSLETSMAIITNAPWDTPGWMLGADLERWGLAGYFQAFVGSGEVAWRKPNPEFMREAAKALGASARECLVVGDNLTADIGGARAAGMRSVWMNRDGAARPADAPQPDWVMRSLEGVVGLLEAAVRADGDR